MDTMDNPRVRAFTVCPLCSGGKDTGLVACWTCYCRHGLRYGNLEAEARITAFETRLRALAIARSPRAAEEG